MNVVTAVRLIRRLTPGMRTRGWGRVIQLARAWAVEFGSSGVTFNTVAAGYIDTPLAHEKGVLDDPEAMAGVLATIPAGRVARPEEVAAAIAYLASADAGYTTGVTLRVDGGLVIA